MFFTRIGQVFAHLIFWLGLIRVATGFLVAFGLADMEIVGRRTSGEAIDQGFIAIVLAVALGVLCEISAARRKSEDDA